MPHIFLEKSSQLVKMNLVFSVSSLNSTGGNEINTPSNTPKIDSVQIAILVGIVMAATGASIYYMKGFRAKH